MSARAILAGTVAGLALTGCGYKGPLTLPEKPGEVTTRPGPAGAKPSSPAEGSKTTPPKTPPETAPPEAASPEVPTRTGGSGG
jgi:predicted small lipoprotein YifL